MSATVSFVSRAEALLNRLAQVQAQREDQAARTVVETAQTRASRSRRALDDVLRGSPRLVNRGVTLPVVSAGTRAEVAKARTALRTTATSIVGAQVGEIASRIGTQSADHALEVGERVAKSLVADLNRSVDKKRVELLPGGIDQRIVSYPGNSDVLVVKLQAIQRRLQSKVESLSIGELEGRLDEIMRDAASWVQERPLLDKHLEGQHPEIREFLRRAASDEGSPWHLVTSEVLTWLSDPENAASLRIVLRS
jgi:hypothetical protein